MGAQRLRHARHPPVRRPAAGATMQRIPNHPADAPVRGRRKEPPCPHRSILERETAASCSTRRASRATPSAEIERRFTAVAPTEVVRAEKGSQRANVHASSTSAMNAVTTRMTEDPLWRRRAHHVARRGVRRDVGPGGARERCAPQQRRAAVLPFSWAEVTLRRGPGHRRAHGGVVHTARGGRRLSWGGRAPCCARVPWARTPSR